MNHIIINFNQEIPKIYDQQRANTFKIYAKYYIEYSDWEWLILEYSKLQRLFFGFVKPENTFRYFTLEELNKIQIDYGVNIELENYLLPKELSVAVLES